MARVYSASFTEVAATAQQDLFQLEALTVPLQLHAVYLSQSSDVGDASAENLSILIRRVTDAVTNDIAEVKIDSGARKRREEAERKAREAAANADIAVNETTELTTGASTIHATTWNILNEFIFLPPPEMRPTAVIGDVICVNLNTTPADSLTISGTAYFSEMGS